MIPAGAVSTTVRVSPKTDDITEGDEAIVLKLTPAAAYSVGTPDFARVTIRDAGMMSAAITNPAEGVTVSGTVTVGMAETGGTGTISWTLRLDGGAVPIFTSSGIAATASFNWDTTSVA